MAHGNAGGPRLTYDYVEDGLRWCTELITCAAVLCCALETSDVGCNMDSDDYAGVFRLLAVIERTMEQLNKDYRAEMAHCRCGQKED
jgi:hypothetical protein